MKAGIPEETSLGNTIVQYKRYKILTNAAQCRKCKTVIESTYRHEWMPCKCGAIFVDGGKDYLRSGGNSEDFLSLAVMEEIPDDAPLD